MKFSFGYPTSGVVSYQFCDSIARMMAYEGSLPLEKKNLGSYLNGRPGCMVARNRHDLARDFITQTNDDYLVMIDPDIEFGPDIMEALNALISRYDNSILTPHVVGGRVNIIPGVPVFFTIDEKNYAVPNSEPFDDLKEFFAVGFGIIAISREILNAMLFWHTGYYYMFNPIMVNGVTSTDDFGFCELARRLGFKIFGAWNIFGVHWKSQPVVSNYPDAMEVNWK